MTHITPPIEKLSIENEFTGKSILLLLFSEFEYSQCKLSD